jgi:hypothetical protein
MIAKIYLENAKNIRNEFLKLTKKLDIYKKELAELVIFLEKKMSELSDYSDNEISGIKNKSDITTVSDHIIKELGVIEAEEQKILRLVSPVNDSIEKLRVEEAFLFNQLKEKYPKLSEKEIIEEINSYLEN